MKKFSVLVFIILGLTIFSFLFSQRLMELIVRIQRSEDPSKVTAEDLMQEVDPVMVAAVQFDQIAIEFYYDISQLENDGLYYTASGKNQRITYPQNFINSINDQYRFFADFNNEFEIYQDDELLKPYQTIEIQINQLNKTIPLYQLDKSKKTTLKSVYTEHDYSFYCSVHSLCSQIETMLPEKIDSFVEKWKKSSWPDDIKYNDLEHLFTIENNIKNYDYLSGYFTVEMIDYSYVQDKNGIQYIVKFTNTNEFYEVTQAQLDEFYSFLKDYQK